MSDDHIDAPLDDRPGDRRAIAGLVAAYARHADRREFESLAELFVVDGVLAIHNGDPETTEPSRERHGRAEIMTAMETLRRYTATHHMLGQHSVWFAATDGARATGETYCLASHVRTEGDTTVMRMMAIRYFDDYVGADGTWRIERRRLAVDWIDEHPMP